MPLVTTSALILQSFPYSETSKILRLLTRTHGLQSVVARGALRPKSRFGGVLEPFTDGSASFIFRESRDLHTLSGFEIGRSRQGLGAELVRFGGGALIAEIVLRTGVEGPDAELFDAVRDALDRLERAATDTLQSVVLAEAWSLIARLGFEPALDNCIGCGRGLALDEEVIFDYASGGVRCADCAAGSGGRQLPPAAREALMRLTAGEAVPLERTGAHWKLLGRFLSHHVMDQAPLHSLEFLAEALADSE